MIPLVRSSCLVSISAGFVYPDQVSMSTVAHRCITSEFIWQLGGLGCFQCVGLIPCVICFLTGGSTWRISCEVRVYWPCVSIALVIKWFKSYFPQFLTQIEASITQILVKGLFLNILSTHKSLFVLFLSHLNIMCKMLDSFIRKI